MRRMLCLVVLLALALSLSVSQVWAAEGTAEEITILYTHDMHSSFLPKQGEDGRSRGGYARLKTLIDGQRQEHPNALVLDGGDFSMGSLFQTVFIPVAPHRIPVFRPCIINAMFCVRKISAIQESCIHCDIGVALIGVSPVQEYISHCRHIGEECGGHGMEVRQCLKIVPGIHHIHTVLCH